MLTTLSRLSLEYLYLGYNKLSSSIPAKIGYLWRLRDCQFNSTTNITGGIRVALGNCSYLKVLDSSLNSLYYNFPAELGSRLWQEL
ncbi:hypothetical protein SUGI_1068810 [Cryptomeria japonica]|nr:hypothetical protein SUGI_1068810 [Cryptomeria japonica]